MTDFIKAHGLGNDFVILDQTTLPDDAEYYVQGLADRHFGIGCDQIIVYDLNAEAPFITFYNSDGSLAEACGNGLRCVAKYLMQRLSKHEMELKTPQGLQVAKLLDDGKVTTTLGTPAFDWQDIPLSEEQDTLQLNLPLPNLPDIKPAALNLGNPHAVYFVEHLDEIPYLELGKDLENDTLFPMRANIGFAEVVKPDHIRLNVWERGAGPTLACGSGACAAAIAAQRRGLIQPGKTTISQQGGDLLVEWDLNAPSKPVEMTGEATLVFVGKTL